MSNSVEDPNWANAKNWKRVVDRINQRIINELVPKVDSSGIIHGSDICKIINEEVGFEDGFINCYPDIRVDELNLFFVEE